MKKIIHVMLAGPVTDGWTYQDNMITKYHKKMGFEVTMITSQWIWGTTGELEKTDKTNYINNHGVKVIRLPLKGRDNFLKKFKSYKGLTKALEEESPDILFVHNVSFADVDTIVAYLKKHKDIEVFVDNHSDFSNSGSSWISRNILHKLIWRSNAKKLEPFTKKFYGVLPARVDWLINMYDLPKEKCELLVMGGDDDEIEKAMQGESIELIREKYHISNEDFLIVTGGKIDKEKWQTLLLMEAVQEIANEHIRLLVFGSVDEELKEKLNSLADGEKVQYIGWINGEDSYKYFAVANLVVFPGRHSVFWEQVAAQGVPMICKYWKGTMHVDCGGNVLFLNEDSVEEIIQKIDRVVKDYARMLKIAVDNKDRFRYSTIAKKSIL